MHNNNWFCKFASVLLFPCLLLASEAKENKDDASSPRSNLSTIDIQDVNSLSPRAITDTDSYISAQLKSRYFPTAPSDNGHESCFKSQLLDLKKSDPEQYDNICAIGLSQRPGDRSRLHNDSPNNQIIHKFVLHAIDKDRRNAIKAKEKARRDMRRALIGGFLGITGTVLAAVISVEFGKSCN
jgi:hypothetical protein